VEVTLQKWVLEQLSDLVTVVLYNLTQFSDCIPLACYDHLLRISLLSLVLYGMQDRFRDSGVGEGSKLSIYI